jgi:hypothetical protein
MIPYMGDQVITSRVANALIANAAVSSVPLPHKTVVKGVLEAFKQGHGGLWVGGRVTLTESALEFAPNAMNRSVTRGELDVRIPLTDITAVTVEFGVVTKIIAIESPARTFRVRCYGADKFAERIRAAMSGSRS